LIVVGHTATNPDEIPLPLGLAYAVWTSIGAAGTFLVGVAFFGETTLLLHWVGVALILGGVACLKLA
jgi:quaternary ammonium compound-resistance protein SugE